MTKTPLRIALALGAFFVLVIALAACGSSSDSIPGNAVAVVDGTPITKASYDHWAAITAKSAASSGGSAVVPDPPAYTQCVAQLGKQKPVKGQPKPSTATLVAQCKRLNTQLVQQTMATLVQAQWIDAEAKKQGVSISDKDVQQQLEQTKKQSFPTAKAYNNFLKQSGMSQDDVLFRLRIQALAQKLTQHVQSSAAPVTDAEVSKYYNQHKSDFAVPERRDLQIVLTKTEAQANAAKAAIQGGMSWAKAASKYSTDAASKAAGGVLRGVAKGQEDRALDKAAFSATKGELVGPVKGQFGWYLVRVSNITPPTQTPFSVAKSQIKPTLTQQAQQKKMTAFLTDFQKRWKDATNCRAGYVIEVCKNAPKPKTTSTAGGTVATTPSTSGK